MSHLAVILNTAAGGGRASGRAEPFLDRLRAAHARVDVHPTEGPGHASLLARRAAADGVDVVVAVGGDGTLFEVINGLHPREGGGPALGVLPLGTGNSFVRDFQLDDPEAAIAALEAGRTRSVDVVRVQHAEGTLHFVNLLSLGFSARAGALTNRRFKGLGLTGYVASVLACLVRLHTETHPYALDDGDEDARPATMVSFCNSRFTGGDMMMAPPADPSDGRVDVVHIGPMGRRRFLAAFPRIFKGTHPELDEIELSRAARVAFAPGDPTDVMIDGEVLKLQLHSLQVLPGAQELVA
jgi:YegS/Rv2252/BmrU family lipid kinase